jgi:hypothetical protein
MMFQRRPFISQREKTLALRDAGQSRIAATLKWPARHRPMTPDAFGQSRKP